VTADQPPRPPEDPGDLAAVQLYTDTVAKRGLAESVAYFGAWNKTLQGEFDRAMEIAQSKVDPFSRFEIPIEEFLFHVRAVVHVFFAQIDGTSYILRQIVLWAHERREIQLTADERADLANVHRKTGNTRFLPIIRNLELGFTHFSRLFGLNLKIDQDGPRWKTFKTTLDLRNDITHPKRLDTFNPSLANLAAFNSARVWWCEQMGALWTGCSEAYARSKRTPAEAPSEGNDE